MYAVVSDTLRNCFGLIGTDQFIGKCIERLEQIIDWNEDDVKNAIRNVLNEVIKNNF